MLNNKTVAVVVPAYNEETQIGMVIETMPDFVDRIIVVNDCSTDKTTEVVKDIIDKTEKSNIELNCITDNIKRDKFNHADFVLKELNKKEINYFVESEVYNDNPEISRIILINLKVNGGVGAAVARGYKWCKDYDIDCIAKVDGDGQMDPDELKSICMPIVEGEVDYVKGNRLIHRSSWFVIPKIRYLGNSILSMLTKIASGYWRISDTQTAYSAISNKAINSIKLYNLYKSYGYPNDLLVKLNIALCKISEVEIKPIYDIGEKSKMKIGKVIPRISWLLIKSFFSRLWIKYLFRDFHPLFLLYHFSFILFFVSLPFLIKIINHAFFLHTSANPVTVLAFMFLSISSFQSFLFAMWMDIQDNERLYKS